MEIVSWQGSMRAIAIGFLVLAGAPSGPARRANFVRVVVTAPPSAAVRAIWRPYAGAVTSNGEDQQGALRARSRVTHPDSLRRWRDPAARDTVVARAPAEFLVDMTAGPILVEAVGRDSIHVGVQLSPQRGPVAASWGRALQIESDGLAPRVLRRR
jgi:hypothetical protein